MEKGKKGEKKGIRKSLGSTVPMMTPDLMPIPAPWPGGKKRDLRGMRARADLNCRGGRQGGGAPFTDDCSGVCYEIKGKKSEKM